MTQKSADKNKAKTGAGQRSEATTTVANLPAACRKKDRDGWSWRKKTSTIAAVELLAKAADEGRRTRNEAAPFTATHSHWLPCRWSALPSPPLCFVVNSPTSCRLVRTREMGMRIGLDFWK
nr:hypothetical protein Iba_chr03aCG3480 [Ipomoea batatas]